MCNNFKKYKIDDIAFYPCDRIPIQNISTENYVSTENLLPDKAGKVNASTLPKSSSVLAYKPGDILISNIRPYLKKIWKADNFGGYSNDVLNFRAKEVESELLFYLLSDDEFFKYAMSTVKGTKMPRGDKTQLLEYEVVVSDDKNVRNISSRILCSYDKKISINFGYIEELGMAIKIIYQNWFNNFNYPNNTGGLENPIPKDWEYRPFGEFIKPFSEKIGELDVPIYSTTNSGISLRDEKFNKNLTKSKGNNKKIVKDDLIFGLSREILNFGVFTEEIGSVSPAYQTFKIDQSIILPFMLELEMRINMPKYMDILQLGAREGQGIRKDYLLKKEYLVPKMEVQLQFAEIYTVIQKKIKLLQEENKVLAEIRDTLLPKLMSGELPVEVGEE